LSHPAAQHEYDSGDLRGLLRTCTVDAGGYDGPDKGRWRYGRPFRKFDASEDFAGVRYRYNARGYLERIEESARGVASGAPAPAVYYEVREMDARGNFWEEVWQL